MSLCPSPPRLAIGAGAPIYYKGDDIDRHWSPAREAPQQMSDTAPIEHPSWLTTGDFTSADEPLRLFTAWLTEATATEPRDPTAMTLATVDSKGLPNARMVLLKGVDERGFVFYTNMDSQKGQELDAQPRAALVFYWKSLNRQVRVRGSVERVSNEEADAYFVSRPKQ